MSNPASASSVRETLKTMFRLKRRLILLVVAIMAAGIFLAATTTPKYSATSTVLIIPGPDYTVRSVAGTNASVNQSLERTEILATEVAILESRDLHRRVLQEIGLQNIYPGYLQPPGRLHRVAAALKARVAGLLGMSGPPEAAPSTDMAMERALEEFDRSFTAAASSESNTITLTFLDKDPATAANALSVVEHVYLDRRRALFADTQSTGVAEEAQRLRERLDDAERRLSDFKVAHDISNFATRQEILLQQQGSIEAGLMEAQSDVDQQQARVTQLQAMLGGTPHQITAQDADVDTRLSAMRASLDTLLAKRAELAGQYRVASPVLQALDAQIARRQGELAASRADRTPSGFHTTENPVYTSASVDLTHAQSDLKAAKARQQKVAEQLAGIQAEQKQLNALEREYSELDRQRLQAQQDYSDTSKILTERRIIEQVQSTKQADVRVLSPVVNPIIPAATRKIILMVAVCFSIIAVIVTVLMANYLRRGFLLAGSVERECGLPVLVVIPELAAISGGRGASIRPI